MVGMSLASVPAEPTPQNNELDWHTVAREAASAWSPFAIDTDQSAIQVLRVEQTSLPETPYGCLALHVDVIARRVTGGSLIGVWRLTFRYVHAYRMRPLYHEGNRSLTEPDADACFWQLRQSDFLDECGARRGWSAGPRLRHFVVRTSLDEAYEVVADTCTAELIPYAEV